MAVLVQARPADPHRLRDEVCRNGTLAEHHRLNIPRSTAATWRSRGPRPGVTLEEFDQDRQQLPDRIGKLRRRARVLAAVVRLLFTLLRISGFRLSGERLLAGDDKARLLRAIAGAEPVLPLRLILRIVGMTPSRYYTSSSTSDRATGFLAAARRSAVAPCPTRRRREVTDSRPSAPRKAPVRLGGGAAAEQFRHGHRFVHDLPDVDDSGSEHSANGEAAARKRARSRAESCGLDILIAH